MKSDQSSNGTAMTMNGKKASGGGDTTISGDSSIRERCIENERVFASFIDLMPARIYLNEDDRHNWLDIISGVGRSSKGSSVSHHDDDQDSEDEQKSRKKKKTEQSSSSNPHHSRINKFDPKYLKTVSQILADMAAEYSKRSKASQQMGMKKLKGLKASIKAGAKKDTSIKVANKSQSKKNSGEAAAAATGKEESSGGGQKQQQQQQQAKRMSKFKEEKRAQIKRQRYDSHCEPQIVDINDEKDNVKSKTTTSKAAAAADRKPILNKNGQVVFSKFDFTGDKAASLHNKKKERGGVVTPATAKPKDYKKLLKQLQEKKEKMAELREAEPERAKELETKSKWVAAMDKAQGVKAKDDPALLRKSIKRMEKKKERSRQGWDERKKQVEEKKAKLQEKRRKNLDKKKEKNKDQKMKRLKKKGRVLPGF